MRALSLALITGRHDKGPIRKGRCAVHAHQWYTKRGPVLVMMTYAVFTVRVTRYAPIWKVIATVTLMDYIFSPYALIFSSIYLWSMHAVINVEAQCKWVSPDS